MMRLYVLDGGRIEILDWRLFQPDAPPGTRRSLAVSCYLVEHPDGTLLWDTGLGDDLVGTDGRTIPDVAVFRVERRLQDQLAEIGHPPETVGHLALSHFHPDHVGNVALFGKARLWVQREDHAAAFGDTADDHGFEPDAYAVLRQQETTLLDGDHDLFGDGSVVLVRVPGHTPGSQALLVRLPATGSVLITGDLAHSLDNWHDRAVPLLNWDAAETQRSFDRAAALLAAEDAQLWVPHDLDQQAALRHAPHPYT
ncbi:Glyoxylase, beta-lactamase superfamily II [Pseudonocardia thermophila]|jgi:Zn-dependent hydrolases, including glyoxylases|uniref:Glyoxylase, beta-lactamase superfamily II n=1 Tax=Pseudonocardia thermophila TaxID=1848 RepID=A0A1M6PQ80_PSETH|nr:N-acyl homoserine lactonase family protein [Pseudonocardia thermophila]SHK10139.1 Glyoxylase, beta-lactamase superfamily II [Pseudonocardia thermophila]